MLKFNKIVLKIVKIRLSFYIFTYTNKFKNTFACQCELKRSFMLSPSRNSSRWALLCFKWILLFQHLM